MVTTTVVRVHEGQTAVKGVGPYNMLLYRYQEKRILYYDVYTGSLLFVSNTYILRNNFVIGSVPLKDCFLSMKKYPTVLKNVFNCPNSEFAFFCHMKIISKYH